ncbi:uncharacterized protein LOC130747739 isoform X2 [Lotus japonicus]|uniref:uncharacterized protein LOC130747739 isoform X2 n=1 Tax=Lotus japonicus TaxID=34305 RepID=UPI00258CE13D|nr:uncharacterized protein LOC130747739 isoform X2 [Lotus japonicus]
MFDCDSPDSKNFQQHIRAYNMMFAFTSPGAKLDTSINDGKGPPTIRIQGQTCHLIGSLLPKPGDSPKFAQLYIYDTENEVQNRLSTFRNQDHLKPEIMRRLSAMLDHDNAYAKSFRMAKERFKASHIHDCKLKLISDRATDGRIYNLPSVSEVAALIVGDVDVGSNRDIILEWQSGKLKRINELYPGYLGLQYPLLFPYGEDGYRHDVLHRNSPGSKKSKRNKVTIREWISFRLQMRRDEGQTLLRARRLFQQFIVDAYTMMESDRLSYIRNHQKELRVDKYSSLQTSQVDHTQNQGSNRGKRIILPSTFVGGRRFMDQLYFDGMAICSAVGFPDLFLTFTCNPNWPEIKRFLKPMKLTAQDRPDIVSRVFKIKFEELMTDLKKGKIFGRVLAYIYTIEFQKRGLPHAHILVFLHPDNKYPNPEDIDKIISAEIPNQEHERELYQIVSSHMIHGPCGSANKSSPCMKNGKCSKYFPKQYQSGTIVDKDGYPIYRRRNNGNTVEKGGIILDNRYVVPYNPTLLLKYQTHMNVEWCNQSTSIKYLFKYINKGYDRITAAIVPTKDQNGNQVDVMDEIKQYLDCRYISSCEACWRVLAFPIHGRSPAVERCYFHLPGEHCVYFNDDDDIGSVLSKATVKESMFTSWLNANKIYHEGRNLTYAQFVSKFVYKAKKRCWQLRKRGYTVGRLNWVPPISGELFYLRMMLAVVKGPCSYEDIRTVGDILHPTFREACFAMGFLEDDREYIAAIKEAKDWGPGHYLRKLFLRLLISNSITRPEKVWQQTWQWLSEDVLYQQRKLSNIQDLQLSDNELQNITLMLIEELLQSNRRSLKDFPSMPYPQGYVTNRLGNKLIYAERDYDTTKLNEEFQNYFKSLTDEQRTIFDTIMKAVSDEQGGMYFLYGHGGTGKTFMWKTLASALRAKGDIVLTVASSGIASLLMPGGRTAHSKFAIPVPTSENSTCNIHQGSELAGLLKVAKLIIWDEAPMSHKFCFEALDKSLRDIMNCSNNVNAPFAGKVIVFGGDFRQILPVIPKGNEREYLSSDSIDKSEALQNPILQTLTPEFLNSLRTSGLPNHKIKLKIGTPIMLMRNLDQCEGLCNGTRMIVTHLSDHVIGAKEISGKNKGVVTYITRMCMSPSQSPWPFKLVFDIYHNKTSFRV